MVFPLEELIKYEDNMYEVTCAASRRAYQLSMLKLPEIDDGGKVVSIAARQVFTGEVEFRLDSGTETPASGLLPNAG
ncbi:MAG: DNA-directed RNA polymerase subunit omega [Spirochaetaceae bacterium]|jgi:DNA-directed RNA polymerase subunit omega|nr:DNA-directed RNA polymerase subunit omega [Spirochaetaceae bacterium]